MDDATPIAIIADAPAPYRIAFHLRVARERPGLKLVSVFTHAQSNSNWSLKLPPEINPHLFGSGDAYGGSPLRAGLRDLHKARAIAALLERERVRAVVINGYGDLCRLRLMRWCRRRGVPYFVWGDSNARGDLARGAKKRVKSLLLKSILPKADGVLSCGSLGQQYFENYGVAASKIFWMPYEPDYALIQGVTPGEIDAAKAAFGLPSGRRLVVFSGRMTEVKRPDLLIDAFARIAADRPEWDLLMVGEGHLREALRQRVPAELAGRVFWTGFVDDQARISALYRGGDVLVLPSDYEPWALVINEAAAAGLAVVASDVVGAAAELVRSGENGFTFKAGDLDDLTEALEEVTSDDGIDGYKGASATVLARWRERADPVEGLCRALASVGVVA
jgi:glycosyltransferase involved in cell wall biosynthesis